MANPTIATPSSSSLLKTSTPQQRRFGRGGIHKARGFERREVRGRIPITRPAKRT